MRLCTDRLFGFHWRGSHRGMTWRALAFALMAWFCAHPVSAQDQYEIRHQQEMLTWTTHYEGLIDGRAGPETTKAIERFRQSIGSSATGRLTPAEIKELERQGNAKKARAKFTQVVDKVAGVSVGVPLGYVTETKTTKWGKHWYGRVAGLAIDTLRFTDFTLDQLYDKLLAVNNRTVAYTRKLDDWFVIAAFENDAAVYVRAELVRLPKQPPEIRGFSIWMSKKRPPDYQALPPAMLSSFSTSNPVGGPAPRPTVRPASKPATDALAKPAAQPSNPSEMPVLRTNTIPTDGPASSGSRCYRGLGDCPPILTFR